MPADASSSHDPSKQPPSPTLSQTPKQEPFPAPAHQDAPNISNGATDSKTDGTAFLDAASGSLLLPGGLTLEDSTGSTSLDEQIQAFTAGLASTLGAMGVDSAAVQASDASAVGAAPGSSDLVDSLNASNSAAVDPLAEYLSAAPSLDATAFHTPQEDASAVPQDPSAAVESLLASLGQLSQQNQPENAQSQAPPNPAVEGTSAHILPQNPSPPIPAPSAPGLDIDALLAEASKNALAEATAATLREQSALAKPAPDVVAAPAPSVARSEPAPAALPAAPVVAATSSASEAAIQAHMDQFMASLQASLAAQPGPTQPQQPQQPQQQQAQAPTSSQPRPAPLPHTPDVASTSTSAAPSPGASASAAKTKPKPKTPKQPVKPPVKPHRRVLGKRKHREIGPMERKMRVERALSAYLLDIDPLVKPSLVTGPILGRDAFTTKMTTIRCTHASVAQKSYGNEKRYFNPPPIVHVTGPLRRYADWGPATATARPDDGRKDEEEEKRSRKKREDTHKCKVSMLVKGDSEELFSNEHSATLDQSFEAKVKALYVNPTGRSKSFRLQLNMLRHQEEDSDSDDEQAHQPPQAKKQKTSGSQANGQANGQGNGSGDTASGGGGTGSDRLTRLPESHPWVSFESAPVTIVSKSSKKTVKPRSQSAQISDGSMIALFNRINSQTARTKYVHSANDGRLTAHNNEWSAFRVTLVSRPPQADLAGAEPGSVTYGSTIILTDIKTGASTDPLVVCKVDKGEVLLPQVDPPATIGLAGSGLRSRRIPVSLDMRLRGLATDSGPISLLSGQKPGYSAAAADPLAGAAAALSGRQGGAKAGPASSTSTPAPAQSGRAGGEDLNVYGPVGQLQKVALMRFVPRSDQENIFGDSEDLESDFSAPRSYLCAVPPDKWRAKEPPEQVGREALVTSFVNTHNQGLDTPLLVDDGAMDDPHRNEDGNSLVFVTPKTKIVARQHGPGTKVVDEVDDPYAFSVIGVSRFEFSFFDTSATEASKDEGPCEVPITPFPLITSMPAYDQHAHTLTTTVTNFIVHAAITSERVPLDVWIGPLGPCECLHVSRTAAGSSAAAAAAAASGMGELVDETEITVKLPSVQSMLDAVRIKARLDAGGGGGGAATTAGAKDGPASAADEVPPHFLLPLLFVNDSDGTAFHSGRHLVCEDLVKLMQAAGHDVDAETLCQLGFGLGDVAGPPKVGAWSVRVI